MLDTEEQDSPHRFVAIIARVPLMEPGDSLQSRYAMEISEAQQPCCSKHAEFEERTSLFIYYYHSQAAYLGNRSEGIT